MVTRLHHSAFKRLQNLENESTPYFERREIGLGE